jgi:hypothetical protein
MYKMIVFRESGVEEKYSILGTSVQENKVCM